MRNPPAGFDGSRRRSSVRAFAIVSRHSRKSRACWLGSPPLSPPPARCDRRPADQSRPRMTILGVPAMVLAIPPGLLVGLTKWKREPTGQGTVRCGYSWTDWLFPGRAPASAPGESGGSEAAARERADLRFYEDTDFTMQRCASRFRSLFSGRARKWAHPWPLQVHFLINFVPLLHCI